MVQDTISDLFIRLKNASHARLERVEGIPYGKYQEEILKVLVREVTLRATRSKKGR